MPDYNIISVWDEALAGLGADDIRREDFNPADVYDSVKELTERITRELRPYLGADAETFRDTRILLSNDTSNFATEIMHTLKDAGVLDTDTTAGSELMHNLSKHIVDMSHRLAVLFSAAGVRVASIKLGETLPPGMILSDEKVNEILSAATDKEPDTSGAVVLEFGDFGVDLPGAIIPLLENTATRALFVSTVGNLSILLSHSVMGVTTSYGRMSSEMSKEERVRAYADAHAHLVQICFSMFAAGVIVGRASPTPKSEDDGDGSGADAASAPDESGA